MTPVAKLFGWSFWQKFWLLACALTLLLRGMLSSSQIESWYTRGIYPIIRKIMETIHAIIPVHWLWVVIILLLFSIVRKIWQGLQVPGSKTYRFGRVLRNTLAYVAMIITLFMWCWGFNYGRVNLYKQLAIKGEPIALEKLKKIALDQQEKIINWRQKAVELPNDTAKEGYQLPKDFAPNITAATIKIFEELNLGILADPKPKLLKPKGTLLRINTAGFYSPWTGEPNIDAGLHPLQIPFVMAHELSHSMGITDEGGCNFLAVLVGRKMVDPTLRYAFELSYWKYVMGGLRRADKKEYEKIRSLLPATIANDLKNIRENSEKYPDLFPKLRNLFYDSYLKSQGVKEGMKSYRQVVNMIVAWDARPNAE